MKLISAAAFGCVVGAAVVLGVTVGAQSPDADVFTATGSVQDDGDVRADPVPIEDAALDAMIESERVWRQYLYMVNSFSRFREIKGFFGDELFSEYMVSAISAISEWDLAHNPNVPEKVRENAAKRSVQDLVTARELRMKVLERLILETHKVELKPGTVRENLRGDGV